jgi:hypothetical protein
LEFEITELVTVVVKQKKADSSIRPLIFLILQWIAEKLQTLERLVANFGIVPKVVAAGLCLATCLPPWRTTLILMPPPAWVHTSDWQQHL